MLTIGSSYGALTKLIIPNANVRKQILSYAQSPSVRQMLADTRLHTIVMQLRGYDLERLEEIKL